MQPDAEKMDPDSPSLNIIFETVKEQVASQSDRMDALETKAGQTLAASSILTAGVGAIATALAKFWGNDGKSMKYLNVGFGHISAQNISIAVAIGILISYCFLLFVTFKSRELKPYSSVNQVIVLRKEWAGQNENSTKAGLVDAMILAIGKNKARVDEKAKWASMATRAIAFQAAFTVLVGAIQLWIG